MNFKLSSKTSAVLGFLLLAGTLVTSPIQGAEGDTPDGVLSFTPLSEPMYAAVIFTPPDNMAIDGIIWYNNDEESVFPSVMVASGYDGVPPNFGDALVVVNDISGGEDTWSELSFAQPVLSETGAVYVIFELPTFLSVTERGVGPGFGYGPSSEESSIFISGDSVEWTQMMTNQTLFVEPVYVDTTAKRVRNILVLGLPTEPVKSETNEVPTLNGLEQPYPNPFNPTTTISFSLANTSKVELSVYDLSGRRVKVYRLGELSAGTQSVVWRGDDERGHRVASGVYFVKMNAGVFTQTRRVVLLK